MTHTGTVVVFKPKEGYGFVRPQDGGPDIFVHFSRIEMDGYKELFKDDVVTFDIGIGPKGKPQAENVRVVERGNAE